MRAGPRPGARAASAAPDHMLLTDARVTRIAAVDCGDPLVELRGDGPVVVDAQPRAHLLRDPARWHARVRSDVASRLEVAAAALPAPLRLVLAEGYRPVKVQAGYFDMYYGQLASLHPDWAPARLRVAASRFVAPPELAPHSTGGAVDVLLVDADGQDVDLGTPLNASPEETEGACFTAAPQVRSPAREHRQVLVTAMAAAGFVNYPTEWWHWSYGDRYWAAVTGAPVAHYAALPDQA